MDEQLAINDIYQGQWQTGNEQRFDTILDKRVQSLIDSDFINEINSRTRSLFE